MVASKIFVYTLVKPKSAKKAFKVPATGSALKICYYGFHYSQGQLTEFPQNFDIFYIKVVGQPI